MTKQLLYMQIKITKMSNRVSTPSFMTDGSAGADLQADLGESVILKPFQRLLIPTGIAIELPAGYEAQVRPRSGLALNYGITVLNTPGTIDSDYRGMIGVILINLGNTDFEVQPLMRIAQLVIAKYEKVEYVEHTHLSTSSRGEQGFGSTKL